MEASYNARGQNRGCDCREVLILLCRKFRINQQSTTKNLQMVFNTLAELCKILYQRDHERCPKQVLRLHNYSFLHAIAVRRLIGTPVKLTMRRMYGRHYHALATHAPILNRIICLRSINTENEERCFNTLKSITNQTSNRKPEHVITNGFLHLQAEQQTHVSQQHYAEEESRISSLTNKLDQQPNSLIPISYILKFPDYFQAHLERISDFLLPGQGVWWDVAENGITFKDGPDEPQYRPQGPPLHHYCSWNIKDERK